MDVTIAKTVEWLKKNGEYEDTLILFTADHAHPFDVWGSVDQEYIQRKTSSEREMRDSIGLYAASGWPGYYDEDGDGFPDNWVSRRNGMLQHGIHTLIFFSTLKSPWLPV